MAKVELSDAADADLDAILRHSAGSFGRDVSERYMLDIARALDRLATYPALGVVRADLRGRPRCVACREHYIFYRIEDERVFVGRVLHKAMDPAQWLP